MEKIENLNGLFAHIQRVETELENARKEVSEKYDIEDYMNPFSRHNYNLGKVKENLIKFAAKELSENGRTLDVEEVYEQFKNKDFDAEEIRNYVKENYDSKAEEIAKKEILSDAKLLKPYNEEITIHKNGKIRLKGYTGDWPDYGGSPMYFFRLMNRLGALERLDLCVNSGFDFSDAINLPTPAVQKYRKIKRNQEELLKKQEISRAFQGSIEAVKLHKNGSIHVWFENQEKAKNLVEALE